MGRTFNSDEQKDFGDLMAEVKRLTTQIEQTDRERGTERPPGAALGQVYERLGIHLVAMARAGLPPFHAIRLIHTVANDAEGLDHATMMAMFAADVGQDTGEPVWQASFDEETCN